MGKSHDLATISDDGISNLKVGTIKSTGGTTAMTVDSSGRVLRSVLPAWRVSLINEQFETAAGGPFKVEFDKQGTENCFIQGGVTLSSGTITVPVAGLYRCGSTIRVDDVSGSYYIIAYIRKNNETTGSSDSYVIADDHGANYHSLTMTDLYQCQANDQLECYVYIQSDTSWSIYPTNSHFNGHLVG